MKCPIGFLVIAGTLVIVASASPASGAILRVPSEYPSLSAAVNAAVSGDEILVADGVYSGWDNWDVVIAGKSILISSENGPLQTILDGEGSGEHRAFDVTVPSSGLVEFRGFTFTWFYALYGGAMQIGGPGECRITDCHFRSNYSSDEGVGGALYLTAGINCDITDCVFTTGSGPIYVDSGSQTAIERCSFQDNYGSPYSGAVGSRNGTVKLSRCLLTGNSPGAVVAESGTGALVIVECVFVNNEGRTAISSRVPTLIEHCTIAHNEGHANGGPGGIRIQSGGSLEMTSTILWDNCGSVAFADLSVTSGSATLTCCNVDSTGIEGWERITLDGEQAWRDPMFCDPLPCGDARDADFESRYSLDANSPSAAWRSPCGVTIGALDVGCGSVHLGACCLDDETCVIAPPEECAALQGEYLGDDSTCESDSCTATPVRDASWGSIKANFR